MVEKYNVPNPSEQISLFDAHRDRFDVNIHSSQSFAHFKNFTPVYSFQYASMKNSNVCLNNKNITSKDFHKVFDSFKKYSKTTYLEMSQQEVFHWHEVKWGEVTFREVDFLRCLTPKITDVETPTVYQFDLFAEARIMGFIHHGIFYVVWLDRNHKAYDRQNKGKKKKER